VQATVKSISLSYEQVAAILQDWINANLLRTAHTVVDIDPYSFGTKTDLQFNIGLEPGIAGEPFTAEEAKFISARKLPAFEEAVSELIAAGLAKQAEPPTNGHGPQEVVPVAPTASPKRRRTVTDDVRDTVLLMREGGAQIGDISEKVGFSESVVYRIIEEQRKGTRS
jgi:hypothetical protein